MSLLTPLFLLGGLVATLPLWLHLLQRQNPVKLPFSSLMFFERRKQAALLERRFRYLLLLAARLAVYALLAIVFAKPIWERPSRAVMGSLPTFHMIVVDTSMSMGFEGRRDSAVAEAESIVNAMESGDAAQILANGPGVRIVTERTRDREELLAAIRSLQAGASRNSYGELIEAVRNLIPANSVPVEVHLISDFQQSALPGRFTDVALPRIATLVPHNIADPEAPNWTLESVKGSTRLYGVGQKARIEVTIAGFGTVPDRKNVEFRLGGKRVDDRSVDVPASGRASVVFEGFDVPKGNTRAEVVLGSGDALKLDDRRLVVFDNTEPAPILFLSGHNRRRDALYYTAALDAGSGAVFEVQAASPAAADRLQPERFAMVVISDVPRLSSLFSERLRNYVEAGGSVLLAVGPKITLAREAPLYGKRLGEARYVPREGERFQVAGEVDVSHPALRLVERFRRVKFFRYAQLWTGEDDEVAARFADGSPMLVEHKVGDGRLLVFASSLDNVWSDLPVHPVFVPFAVESARYLSGLEESRMQAVIDSVLALRKRRAPGSTVQAFDPQGDRVLSLSQSISEQDLAVTELGFYEIRRTGESELIAVNPDPRESNLRPMDADMLALWQTSGGGGGEASSGEGTETPIELPPFEIWRWLLVLLLLAALIESIVGNQHLIERREVRLS